MNYGKLIFGLLAFIFLFSQCKFDARQQNKNEDALKDNRTEMPGYSWLADKKHLDNAHYQDSFNYYFNTSVNAKKWNDAASYLMANGKALNYKLKYDSTYYKRTKEFVVQNSTGLSGESLSFLYYYLGSQAYYINHLDDSYKWLEKCVSIRPESDLHKQIQGFAHFAIARHYSNLREHESAEKQLIDALNIFVAVGDLKNQGTVYLLMHDIYMQSSMYDDADVTLSKGLQIVKQQKSDFLTFSAYGLFVHLNVAKADTAKAIQYIDTMIAYAPVYKDMIDYHRALLDQLTTFKYIALRNEDSAAFYLNKAQAISKKILNPDIQMRTLFQEVLFSNHFDKPLKDPKAVEKFYAELAADEEPNRQFMVQMATALYRYYQNNKHFEQANIYARHLMADVNKISEDRNKGRLFELEKKFESKKKENTILQQEQQLDERKLLIIVLISSVVIIVFSFLIYVFWNKNKINLKEKLMTQHFAAQLLLKTEEERKRIASDLHDSVSNELVNLRHAVEHNNVQLKDKIDNILEEVRVISRNLSPTLFDKIGLEMSIEQLTEKIQNQHGFFLTSEIQYKGTLGYIRELQVYRIIQEAVTNILKHSEAVAAKISINEENDTIHVEIKDNGKGFEVDKMLAKGNCFGLLNITERVKYINGNVLFKSNKSGTVITINIPV